MTTDNTTAAPADAGSEPVITIDPRDGKRAVVSGTFGTALEWFDFAVYGTLSATLFPALFFNNLGPETALLASFATFGAGMIARPLGGIFFGTLGDRIGRRNVLMFTLVLMGVASVAIGLLPTYDAVGLLAPTLLVLLRFLQGFALGGETSGVQTLVAEHAPPNRRGLYGGLLATGSPLAQAFASLTLTGLAVGLSEQAFNEWGWRIPFLLGLFLIIIGAWIRRNLEETPAFKASKLTEAETAVPQERALAVVVKHPATVLKLIGAWAASAGLFWICVTYAVSYLTSEVGWDRSTTFLLVLLANVISIPAAIFGGALSDRIGRKKAFLLGLTMLGVAAGFLFTVLTLDSFVLSLAVVALALCGIQITAGTQAAFFSEALPTTMRYTGNAMGQTFAGLIFGAPMPFIAAWLFQNTANGVMALTLVGLGLVTISVIATLLLPERYKETLHR